jgi:hypothetical protein
VTRRVRKTAVLSRVGKADAGDCSSYAVIACQTQRVPTKSITCKEGKMKEDQYEVAQG